MSFKVTQQFGGGRETLLQQFPTLESAKKHAQTVAEIKLSMKIDAVFRIYDLYDDVIATYDTKKLTPAASDNTESDSSGGKGQGATFRPTPLATAPRPPGMPANNWVNKPEEDEDK